MRKLLALVSVMALTGCAVQEPAPVITPVNLKYCSVSDSAGYNDDSLNRSVYAAMQQLKIQTGAAVMAIEVSEKLTAADAIQKLIDANCDAVVTSGAQLVNATLAAAKRNSEVYFYSVSDASKAGISTSNFTALTFNIYQAAFAAGFLAAASVADGAEINVQNKINTASSSKIIEAFASGIERFNNENQKKILLSAGSQIESISTVLALAGNSTQLPELNGAKIIGFGRDWYGDSRNEDVKNTILTSIIRVDSIGKVVDAVVNQKVSQHFDLSNDGVGLVDAQAVSWPIGFVAEESQIAKDFQDGKVKVD